MNRDFSKSFLGAGWKFPIAVDEATGRISISQYEEDIKEAIKIIIMTNKGERVMRPEFGCNIHKYIFGGMDYTTIMQMESEVREALINWEPRITDIEVSVEMTENQDNPLINISYVVRATNNPYNLVYPYFIKEGSE